MLRSKSRPLIYASTFFFALALQNAAQGQESADEVARELSNPATALASLGNKLEFRSFDGDLPDADDQTSIRYIFQPVRCPSSSAAATR